MPIYEYRCAACGGTSEFLVGVASSTDTSLVCASCGGTRLERLMSRINIGQSFASSSAATGPCGGACDLPPQARGCCGGACAGH